MNVIEIIIMERFLNSKIICIIHSNYNIYKIAQRELLEIHKEGVFLIKT